MTYKQSKCRSCQAPVIWVGTVKGKKMPLDADTVAPAGSVFTILEQFNPETGEVLDTGLGIGIRSAHLSGITKEDIPDHEWRTCHFATCPDADDWRKGR